MNVDRFILDRTARTCRALSRDLDRLCQATMRGNVAKQLIHQQGQARITMHELVDAGAVDPTGRPPSPVPTAPNVPLHLLDSPPNQRLLRALEEAHAAALEVDNERGIEDGFADVIEHLAAGVATEVHGPADVRRG
jgi:hypothetical protein